MATSRNHRTRRCSTPIVGYTEYVSRCAARARVPHHRKLSSRIIFQINFRNISYIARLCQEQCDPILKKKMILANHLCREKWKGRMYNEKLFDIVVIILLDTFLKWKSILRLYDFSRKPVELHLSRGKINVYLLNQHFLIQKTKRNRNKREKA